MVVRANDSLESLKRKVKVAAMFGCWQATLTKFPLIRPTWAENCNEERLLGVSLTGIMDNPVLNNVSDRLKRWLSDMKGVAISETEKWCKRLDINMSVAITTGKPSGCTSLDTNIRLINDGIEGNCSMEHLFLINGYTKEDLQTMQKGSWLPLRTKAVVFDLDDNEQEVTKLYVNGIEEVYELEFDDGKVYKFTGNHKLLTDNGWKRVDELTLEDNIIAYVE